MENLFLAWAAQVHAQDQAPTRTSNMQNSVESLVRTLLAWKVERWTMYRTDLEATVFGKPSHLEIPPTTNVPDMLHCGEPNLGLVTRMRFNLLDRLSLKRIELSNLKS
eukprot:gnl/MRDRNA2_/MRDRNA2_84354_c0_seq5.p1 gnl/MRDRNA2_/MRDRNA2_84354_c0~~gnl/MRDRNA2_/MRDRNA2_84354_c0_seq5.p1  ORF type:complete len:108 (+),score=18.25 gnl/MRDRNA2_/MRDRNA2_84354_c0_seq5:1-324(+)